MIVSLAASGMKRRPAVALALAAGELDEVAFAEWVRRHATTR